MADHFATLTLRSSLLRHLYSPGLVGGLAAQSVGAGETLAFCVGVVLLLLCVGSLC